MISKFLITIKSNKTSFDSSTSLFEYQFVLVLVVKNQRKSKEISAETEDSEHFIFFSF